jgi:hypothetical protein
MKILSFKENPLNHSFRTGIYLIPDLSKSFRKLITVCRLHRHLSSYPVVGAGGSSSVGVTRVGVYEGVIVDDGVAVGVLLGVSVSVGSGVSVRVGVIVGVSVGVKVGNRVGMIIPGVLVR